jgi:competence ComEA-like helix-hairpin-helix protein
MLHTKRLLALAPRELALWTGAVLVGCVWGLSIHVSRAQSVRESGTVSLRLDLNSANANELEMLPGIGPRRARLILEERHRCGAFETAWQLARIPGLNKALVERVEPLIQIRPPAPAGASIP